MGQQAGQVVRSVVPALTRLCQQDRVFIGGHIGYNGLDKYGGYTMSGRDFGEGFRPASDIHCTCACEASCFTELLELPVSKIVKMYKMDQAIFRLSLCQVK